MKEEIRARLPCHILCYCKRHGEDCMAGICVAAVTSAGQIALTVVRASFPRTAPGSQILGAATTCEGRGDRCPGPRACSVPSSRQQHPYHWCRKLSCDQQRIRKRAMAHFTSLPWGESWDGDPGKLLCLACIPSALVMPLPTGAPGAHQPCQEATAGSSCRFCVALAGSLVQDRGWTHRTLGRRPYCTELLSWGLLLAEKVDGEWGQEQEAGNCSTKWGGFHAEPQQADQGDAIPTGVSLTQSEAGCLWTNDPHKYFFLL